MTDPESDEPADEGTLLTSLLAVQAEAPALPKDRTNPHFGSKFTSLDKIVETVGPLLSKHDLIWITLPSYGAHGHELSYQLIHAPSGASIQGTMKLELSKSDMQGLGSALTYARRYSITAVLDLVADEDDDGNAAASAPASAGGSVNMANVGRGLSDQAINSALDKAGLPTQAKPFGLLTRVPADKADELAEALEAQRAMA